MLMAPSIISRDVIENEEGMVVMFTEGMISQLFFRACQSLCVILIDIMMLFVLLTDF